MAQLQQNDTLPKLKTIVGLIVATSVAVSTIWGFFFFRNMALKDEQLRLVQQQNADLREFGAVPEAVKRLEDRLIPLNLAFPMDPLKGRIKIGAGQDNATEISMLIIEAENSKNQRRFDLAAAKLDKIDALHPGFRGTPYFRFLIEKEKGNTAEALALAEQAIQVLPDDNRIMAAYAFSVTTHVKKGNKKKAEDLCLAAMRIDPENEDWLRFFKQNFGYEPTIQEQ